LLIGRQLAPDASIDGGESAKEVLVQFDEPITCRDGVDWSARACGREDGDGRWSGWLEFSRNGDDWRATDVESVQPNRRDLEYWVTGLSRVYLQGALMRALSDDSERDAGRASETEREAVSQAPSSGPRHHAVESREIESQAAARPMRAILDPFTTYAQGEGVLRSELSALSADHLRNIAAAFNLESPETASVMRGGELIDRIVAAARQRSVRSSSADGTRESPLHPGR
jgi:hypothetical protein